MDDKLFAGLHEGLLVHRLYLMSGMEILDTSPAHWKVLAMVGECIELILPIRSINSPYSEFQAAGRD